MEGMQSCLDRLQEHDAKKMQAPCLFCVSLCFVSGCCPVVVTFQGFHLSPIGLFFHQCRGTQAVRRAIVLPSAGQVSAGRGAAMCRQRGAREQRAEHTTGRGQTDDTQPARRVGRVSRTENEGRCVCGLVQCVTPVDAKRDPVSSG